MNNNLITTSGQQLKIGFFHNVINPDCSISGTLKPVVKITGEPQHGTLAIVGSEDFPNFPPNSPFYKCNDTSMSGQSLYYTVQAGYIGIDRISISIFTSDGHELDINSTINVK